MKVTLLNVINGKFQSDIPLLLLAEESLRYKEERKYHKAWSFAEELARRMIKQACDQVIDHRRLGLDKFDYVLLWQDNSRSRKLYYCDDEHVAILYRLRQRR